MTKTTRATGLAGYVFRLLVQPPPMGQSTIAHADSKNLNHPLRRRWYANFGGKKMRILPDQLSSAAPALDAPGMLTQPSLLPTAHLRSETLLQTLASLLRPTSYRPISGLSFLPSAYPQSAHRRTYYFGTLSFRTVHHPKIVCVELPPNMETLTKNEQQERPEPSGSGLFVFPSQLIAQFQNKDRIKISSETVQSPITATKQIT